MQRNFDDLQVEFGKDIEVEGELAQIAESQGWNVGELIDFIKDNGIVLKAQEVSLQVCRFLLCLPMIEIVKLLTNPTPSTWFS